MKDTAAAFWNRPEYPKYYGNIKQRRLYELQWLVPQLAGMHSLLDVGCGDGAMLNCLRHLTDMELTGCDFSQQLMQGVHPSIRTFKYDCYSGEELPYANVVLCAGVISYLFEDGAVHRLLEAMRCEVLFIRATCTQGDADLLIDGHSEHLGEQYASRYLAPAHFRSLVAAHFKVEEMVRAYPDSIESPLGTRQYYIRARR